MNADSDLSMLDKFDKNMESVDNVFYSIDKNKKIAGSTFFSDNSSVKEK